MKTTEDETWKDVPGFEERYKVSDRGRVMRKQYSIERPKPGNNDGTYIQTFDAKMMTQHDCNGYRTVNLSTGNQQHETVYVHRLVLKAFAGSPPTADHEANHVDGDKANNALSNLEWVTQQQNITHAVENGLQNSGHKETKIPAEDIPVLRERWENEDVSQQELADQYGVRRLYMNQIINGTAGRAAA